MSDDERYCRKCAAPGWELCPDCEAYQSSQKSACPPIYQKTDIAKLHEKAKALLEFQYSPQGLVIYGQSGTQKTRVAWLIVNRWIKEGKRVGCFDSLSFAHLVDRKFGDGDGPEWIEEVCRNDAVFFDDIDKCKLTARVEAEMFGLVEKFTSQEKPIIVTSNTHGQAFEQRFSPNIGPALYRRLKDFCRCELFQKAAHT